MIRISIVLPCFNMEDYIEDTLLSIINQNYSNLELIVVDGASTDNTLSILKKYDDYIDILISEKDLGQYNAINKGMSRASGKILAWINADDIYFPWTLKHVSNFFQKHSEIFWVSGSTSLMDEYGLIKGMNRNPIVKPVEFCKNGWFRKGLYGYLQQEGMFWRRELWENAGGLNESYKLASDFELWTRFAKYKPLVSFALPLACFRVRSDSRSNLQEKNYLDEVNEICKNLKKPNFLISYFSKQSLLCNIIIRKFTLKTGLIYFFSPKKNKWILKKRLTSMATYSFTNLFSLK